MKRYDIGEISGEMHVSADGSWVHVDDLADAIRDAEAAARAEQRERDAGIAERGIPLPDGGVRFPFGWLHANIAAAIRKGDDTP